jgi:uncharacterized protein YcbK (DUF882 family)
MILALGSRGLETAIANGDTRTLTMHHIHTDEDITITYKRDGKYDEEALKQLDWFVRDWREQESTHMDPQLFDLVWEVQRQAGSDQPIYVVCGYRSPKTNAMLRHRTSGVAQHSQHILGKAMDFYVPGAALEEVRNIGLRLQRGGVGYYPHSGAPFVHLDVGPVRHWGPIPADQVARAMSGARIADAAHTKMSPAVAQIDEDEDADAVAAAPHSAPAQRSASSAARRGGGYTLASAESRPAPAPRQARMPAPQAVPAAAPAEVAVTAAATAPAPPAPAARQDWAYATEAPRPPEPVKGVSRSAAGDDDITGGTWPLRAADNDRVPLDIMMSYAAQPQPDHDTMPGLRPESIAEAPLRAAPPARAAMLRDAPRMVTRDNVTTVAKKTVVRPAAADPVVRAKPVVAANPGMRYDDPWLRAMILAPSISNGMTATLYGDPDFAELRTLMNKPTSTLVMSFGDEAYPGIAANRFSGDAVVFLTTHVFERRTASLR